MHDVLEAWKVSNRINIYLLEAIEEQHLADKPTASRGRSIGEVYAHLHNVRLMWLEVTAPKIFSQLTKVEKDNLTKSILSLALQQSGDAIAEMLQEAFANDKVRGMKGMTPMLMYSYMIAHEAHHRGQIMLALKQCGHLVPKEIQYGLWDWVKFTPS